MKECNHDHVFGQNVRKPGESRTLLVICVTAVTMVVEISAGIVFGSMALLADGLHMASHAVALTINAFAYYYARKYAGSERFSFGTGKVNALGGFTGAILLAGFALIMVGESIHRFVEPVSIAFNQAILVALAGLVVNGLSVLVLGHDGHDHHHDHSHEHHDHHSREHTSKHRHEHHHHHDHNLRAAYLHVLADALTSVLAIVALLAGKYFGWNWMDPAMGIVGAALVAHWSWGLIRQTSSVLLDHQDHNAAAMVRDALEADDSLTIMDLHVWSIGPGLNAAEITLNAANAKTPDAYRTAIPEKSGVVHVAIEVHGTG